MNKISWLANPTINVFTCTLIPKKKLKTKFQILLIQLLWFAIINSQNVIERMVRLEIVGKLKWKVEFISHQNALLLSLPHVRLMDLYSWTVALSHTCHCEDTRFIISTNVAIYRWNIYQNDRINSKGMPHYFLLLFYFMFACWLPATQH